MFDSFFKKIFQVKPIEVILAEENSQELKRELRLFDLLCIGIGGTVGTGIFATAGKIIHNTAGPAACISWILGGIACSLSGFSYMELSSRIPSSGSCYAYTYHILGELPAMIAGLLLTLEYAMSGAGVARSWSEKVYILANTTTMGNHSFIDNWLHIEHFDILAFFIQAIAVIILLMGLNFGKHFINVITIIKVTVVGIMILFGLILFNSNNIKPFIPPRSIYDEEPYTRYGGQGVVLGATEAFFGYVGFDEVCCLAAEAKNPRKIMPIAVLGVIIGTMLLSSLASFSLSGMENYLNVNDFPMAFNNNKHYIEMHIVRWGEILTMPVVVLVAFLAQPRLFYVMACDGLFPKIFSKVNKNGNLFYNTLITGIFFSFIALFVPFDPIWALVDFGVLFSFNITNSCVIVLRMSSTDHLNNNNNNIIKYLQGFYVILSGLAIIIFQKSYLDNNYNIFYLILSIILATLSILSIYVLYNKRTIHPNDINNKYFLTPLVPFLPCLAIAVNWYLIAQIEIKSLFFGMLWICLAPFIYFIFGYKNSEARNNWKHILDSNLQDNKNIRNNNKSFIPLSDVRPSINYLISENRQSNNHNDNINDSNRFNYNINENVNYNNITTPIIENNNY